MAVDLALCGEAWGAEEEEASRKAGFPRPFVGNAGKLLNTVLAAAGVDRTRCLVTNVFNLRPPENKLKEILVPKKEAAEGWPAVQRGGYLSPDLETHVLRLYREVLEAKPRVIVPLGATAVWAFSGATNIMQRRGHISHWRGIPVIPTFHPAAVLRRYQWFVPVLADIKKAFRYMNGQLELEKIDGNPTPTLTQIDAFIKKLPPGRPVVVDIETAPKFRSITSVGFGNAKYGMCVPFADPSKPGNNYWKTVNEELHAWELLKGMLEDPALPKIVHHGIAYDLPWLVNTMGIRVSGQIYDTRILHAAKWTEMAHDLGQVAASWCLFPPWKAQWKSSKDTAPSGGEDGDGE